ncbi:MAG: hypothetical protein P1V13_08010 [Rhizobiaceae bacterium]|nr:hypothetical protein [Rhizobiaceae bacterium]
MIATFLKDNGFSDKASGADYTYIKNVTDALKKEGQLHAHLKVVFTDNTLTHFDIHGTVRTQADADALAKGTADAGAVGRAIWVYHNKMQRSPADHGFWLKKGGTTFPKLKSYCRQLADIVSTMDYEIAKHGGTANQTVPANAESIDRIGLWV